MTRNLDKRIELLFPIQQADHKQRVVHALRAMFRDNVKARVLQADGRGGSDTYLLQLLGGATNASISIADSGSDGADTVVVTGTAGAERIELTSTLFRQGSASETLAYSGLESFEIHTVGGADEVLILSTHAGSVSVDSGDGDDAIALRGIAGPTEIRTGGCGPVTGGGGGWSWPSPPG